MSPTQPGLCPGASGRAGFIVGKDASGISLKWKNFIKHSIWINYIVALISIAALRSSSSSAGGLGLKAPLEALILEASICARGAPEPLAVSEPPRTASSQSSSSGPFVPARHGPPGVRCLRVESKACLPGRDWGMLLGSQAWTFTGLSDVHASPLLRFCDISDHGFDVGTSPDTNM